MRKAHVLIIVLLTTLLLSACAGTPTPAVKTTTQVISEVTQTAQPTGTPIPPTDTPLPPTATLTPTPKPPTPTPIPPTDTPTPIPPTDTPTPTPVPPTPTPVPPTVTPIPPTNTPIPTPIPPTATPTPVDWTTADWTVIAKMLLQGAKTYKVQMEEMQTMLGQDQVDCPRTVELLDSLANAPQYKDQGLDKILWERRNSGSGIEAQLYDFWAAYGDGVNQFRLDTFRAIQDACVAGTQPTAEQRQKAIGWMNLTGPIGKMDHVINNLEPMVGP